MGTSVAWYTFLFVLSPEMMKRRIGEGAEFFRFPRERQATER